MLRHSYSSILMMDCHIPLPAVSKLLGHASIQTTVDEYGHLLPEAPTHEAMEQLAAWHHTDRHNFRHTPKGEGP